MAKILKVIFMSEQEIKETLSALRGGNCNTEAVRLVKKKLDEALRELKNSDDWKIGASR